MKFLYKVILVLGILIALSCFVQFVVFNKFFIANTNSLLLSTNEKASENVSMQLVENFNKIQNFVKTVAANEEIRENQELLNKFNAIIPEVDVVTIFNSRGDILHISGNAHIPNVSNLAYRDYFQQAVHGKTYISNVFTSTSGVKVVVISVPIVKDGSIDGVVVGAVKLQGTYLASMFDNKKFGRNGYISILDSKGYVVYHPNKELIGKKSVTFDKLQGKSRSKIMKDYSGKEQFVGFSKVPNLNWYVLVITPTADIMTSRNIVVYETFLGSVVVGILIILLGIYTIKRYSKPLNNLIFSFNALKDGKYKKIEPHNYGEEFQEMVIVYNNTIERLKKEYNDLEEAADIDSLTGAYNRRAFNKFLSTLKQEMSNCGLGRVGALLLDIDNFKKLNDTSGHLAGDNVLKNLAEIMKSSAGDRSVFRFGGDEFAVVIRNISDERLLSIAEAIRLKCEETLNGCTVSIGAAKFPKDTYSIDKLIDFADKALYISKKSRNKVTIFVK
ncbi:MULTISPECIES: sensor domain-containing diguanylate cyclase [Clostridium]|uniref:Diguanylate cyclase YdaM n=2 Tax=Clostridium TaxID=1485 RepID=D8GUG3_CLOLD|nr:MULTISPECIES: diguanylate cyclase [Clostridium]ADK14826.1 putative signal chemotaxis receptor [Clostridium ljungdahlii DSM 13528]AGY78072.1 diguanylate cyclase [Clostridium autoethanogenum DSM 10061]ALU38206.1 Diguanylate cyclase with Cache-1 sensor [Clostridium autoethanogenum DSM 10061]OAA87822.1 putative diguanylate cyclase YdaM [Clostridium ljungdahlii DSM 13528]OVY50969.1 putative diguanylate cyclase YdaM [Clostridium autoethanogenum]